MQRQTSTAKFLNLSRTGEGSFLGSLKVLQIYLHGWVLDGIRVKQRPTFLFKPSKSDLKWFKNIIASLVISGRLGCG